MNNYDDIINMPYGKSERRKPMPRADRAVQFAPFAALTGYDAAVRETARLTDKKIELDEYAKEEINGKLQQLCEMRNPEAEITYFVPDKRKSGGKYVIKTGTVAKIKEFERRVVFSDGTEITVEDIIEIQII